MRKLLPLMLVMGMLILVLAPPPLSARDQTTRMNQVIDNLLESYANLDSVSYRKHFSSKMLFDEPLSKVGSDLREASNSLGKMASAQREINSAGNRALVTMHFENNIFDMHLRLDKNGKLTRVNLLPHKDTWSGVSTMTAKEIGIERKKYETKVNEFAKAFMEKDATKLIPLFPSTENDPDAPTLEDHEQMVNRFGDRGDFKRVGEIGYLGHGDVSIPLMTSDDEGFEFVVTFNPLGKIIGLRLTNWAPVESQGKTLADIGTDTLKTSDLIDISALGDAFRADSGKVRFVTLLSPT